MQIESPTPSQYAEAAALRSANPVDASGRIIAPGKFEGEPVFALYYWSLGLDGFADSDIAGVYCFRITKSDRQLWPELDKFLGRKRTLCLSEDSSGFVHAWTPRR